MISGWITETIHGGKSYVWAANGTIETVGGIYLELVEHRSRHFLAVRFRVLVLCHHGMDVRERLVLHRNGGTAVPQDL